MSPVRTAVIPAAGLGTRFLPASKAIPKEMVPVVDRPTIQYIVEEAVAAGIDDILVIVSDGKESIGDHFDRLAGREAALEAKGKVTALFYLTARTTGRRAAELALERMRAQGLERFGGRFNAQRRVATTLEGFTRDRVSAATGARASRRDRPRSSPAARAAGLRVAPAACAAPARRGRGDAYRAPPRRPPWP